MSTNAHRRMGGIALVAGSLALLSHLAVLPATAQDGAAPRDIPEGFVLPGPPPVNAPEAEEAKPPSPAETPVSPMSFARTPEKGTTDWPCIQRRVETISPAQIWNGPDVANAANVERTDAMRVLADQIVARRLPLDEAAMMVKDFVAELPENGRGATATAIVTDILDRLNKERGEVMVGIERYGAKQKALAKRLREQSADFADLRQRSDASPTKIEEARQALLWDTRIFDERRQSLTYVCEVPVLIEQRAFGLGRAIASAL
ncbi:hypothetical protein VSX64_03080 [Aurantimonas sp. C2-6-R+9]|uniref:hypothetical protein n=1 Tax=unclassified Aurantimonas TaxID=2638230 RepID=UPI002E198540|nr:MULTISPECIES: hypothetical protein [unclassified Aurantimonas]MEC5290295.1 hypothetical protein [Aurantimonas sp. C2-3-R2]MEC5379873.1 hypothetical protein [Aurantimonas sp. C2-6-R+9]MEC5411448.1 hypothetical protein [Aurantimonas sp. C2-4-R8]